MTEKGNMSLRTLEFTWEVHFTDLIQYQKKESPTFTFSTNDSRDTKWVLLFYPAGSRAHNIFPGHYTSFYFVNSNKCGAEASFNVSILNQNHVKVIDMTLEKQMFELGKSYGFPLFIEKSFILNPKNNIVKDNKITFLCTLIIQKQVIKNKSPENSFSRIIEFDDFEKLLADKDFSDVTIIIDEKKFNAHKCILASRSPVFEAMFKHNMKERNQNVVHIDDMEFEVFQEFIRFIYSGKINEIEKVVCGLLFAAEKYSVLGLKKMCEDTMCSGVNAENAIKYLPAADMNNATRAKTEIIKWISSHTTTFFKNSEFKALASTHPLLFYEVMENKFKE